MSDLDLALIGNCTFGALVDRRARIVWSCLPRFDADPVFFDLLDGKGDGASGGNDSDGDGAGDDAGGYDADGAYGFYDIEIKDFARSEQHYLHNTAILVTVLYDKSGSAVEVVDFAPRYKQFERFYRPVMIVRVVRPVIGTPTIRVRLRPAYGYGLGRPDRTHGSNHIRYVMPDQTLRLTTNAPVSFVLDEVPFLLEQPVTLILGPDESLTEPLPEMGRSAFEKTQRYWREWTRYLSIPFEWQGAVIRAAITLKLSSFEESGAVVAAMTTSIPESPDSGRNWDYRFCWMRDAYFVVHALNRLGATRTMEEYMRYILNVAATGEGDLQPVYGITLESRLEEHEAKGLAGYRGMGPVRVGNQAYKQVQNDVFGSVVLASTQAFFDERLRSPGTARLFERLEELGEQAVARYNQPDASLWELRSRTRVHTFSSVMCWAACDRLAKIGRRLELGSRAEYWRQHANKIHADVMEQAWSPQLNSFVDSFGGSDLDASLLLLHEVGFIEPTDPRFVGTVEAIEKALRRDKLLFRYVAPDDIGAPETAFTVCSFWYVDALAAIGRTGEARELFEHLLACRNHVGLLSEDIDPNTHELWGNFPQTYSMVGLINSAMRLSRTWEEAF